MGVFVGRDSDLATLRSELAMAIGGTTRTVLIEGPAGIGKTALIERALAERPQLPVIRIDGAEAERDLALALVDQFRSRLGTSTTEDPGSTVAEALTSDVPRVLFVDDAQWADQPSLEALVFALRRLHAVPLLTVVAGRPATTLSGLRRLADGPSGTHVLLDAFVFSELRELAVALGRPLPGCIVDRIWQHTQGDLRSARWLLAHAGDEALNDFERYLPVPPQLAEEVQSALSLCTPLTVAVVEAASVIGSGAQFARAAAVAGIDPSLASLDEAVDAGLLRVRTQAGLLRMEFTPPARGVAVYERLRFGRRADLHRAAAALAPDDATALLHLAAAAPGPDAALSGRLDALAQTLRDRRRAASLLIAASRLSESRALAEDRLIRGVDWLLLAGDAGRARSLRGEVEVCAPSARRDSVLGQAAIAGDRVRQSGACLEAAWRQCDPVREPELAAIIAHRRAFHDLIHLRDAESGEWARRALELAPEHELAVEWRATLALTLWRRGRRDEAFALLDGALSGEEAHDAPLRGMHAWLRIVGDDVDPARDDLAAAVELELRMGAREIGVVGLNVLARAHFAVGDWDQADRVARRAARLAYELEDVSARVFVWWAAVLVPAARGDWAAVSRFVLEAAAEPTDAPDRLIAVALAHAVPAAARGRFEEVIATLEPITAIAPAAVFEDPGFWPWQPIFAEGLVATGRLDEATAFLDRHAELAAARNHATLTARLGVARGRLLAARGEVDQAQTALRHALELLEDRERPYDLALAQLAFGQLLRREGRRRPAAELLTRAAATFSSLGARPAFERAQRELEASGVGAVISAGGSGGLLTPQELTVAQLVAGGRSNREAAAELQLSVKTVEVHLTRIYAKLGIGSRTQLARHLPSVL